MMKNNSEERLSHPLFHSPEARKHTTHLSSHEQLPIYHIEKGRALSHKKLSLTSTMNKEEQSSDKHQIRFMQSPTFEPARFYKNPSRPSLLIQSKKGNNEDGKVSLKTSNYGFQNEKSTKDAQMKVQFEAFKREIGESLKRYVNGYEKEIKSQQTIIQNLQRKIDITASQLIKKDKTIEQMQQKMRKQKTPTPTTTSSPPIHNFEQIFNKISDLEKILRSSSQLCHNKQLQIEEKTQEINSKFLHYIILKKQSGDKLEKLNNKLRALAYLSEEKIKKVEEKVAGYLKDVKVCEKIESIEAKLLVLHSQVTKIGEKNLCTKSTIGVENWESFDDYQESQSANVSRVSSGDVFFYPAFGADSCCFSTETGKFSESSRLSESSTYKLEQIIKVIEKQNPKATPLQCWLDKFDRLIPSSTSRPLRNEEEQYYYKLTEKEIEYLEKTHYIEIVSQQKPTFL